jgi:uncharacterized protein YndB with AHSA1/START domain
MTYEMRIERMLDAPAELVFDTILDPAFKDDIYTDMVEGWIARRVDVDLRIGGTWRTEFGPRDSDGPIDAITNVFTAIDRPRRLAYETSMSVSAWGRTVEWIEELTFEDHDGKDAPHGPSRVRDPGGSGCVPGWDAGLPRRVAAGGRAAREGGGTMRTRSHGPRACTR